MGNWQNWRGKWTSWWNFKDQSHLNPTIRPHGPPCTFVIWNEWNVTIDLHCWRNLPTPSFSPKRIDKLSQSLEKQEKGSQSFHMDRRRDRRRRQKAAERLIDLVLPFFEAASFQHSFGSDVQQSSNSQGKGGYNSCMLPRYINLKFQLILLSLSA